MTANRTCLVISRLHGSRCPLHTGPLPPRPFLAPGAATLASPLPLQPPAPLPPVAVVVVVVVVVVVAP